VIKARFITVPPPENLPFGAGRHYPGSELGTG
jgi:hypothetical protein